MKVPHMNVALYESLSFLNNIPHGELRPARGLGLFVADGFYRVQIGSFLCRIPAEEYTGHCTYNE